MSTCPSKLIALSAAFLLSLAPSTASAASQKPALPGHSHRAPSIVGTWIVKDATAPFPFHMYVFNADGTMQQANPDAGDAKTSDSDGKGIWVAKGNRIKGKWVEITADRATHKFAGRLELSFDLQIDGDRLIGSRSAMPFDADGKRSGGPFQGDFTGTRVTLP
jgi:hypothetical protein